MLRVSVVLFSALCVAYAAQSIGPLQPKPAKFSNVPGCYVKDLDQVIPFGQAAPDINSCMEYSCSEDLITYTTCGVVRTENPFNIVDYKIEPYPDCCPKLRKNPRGV